MSKPTKAHIRELRTIIETHCGQRDLETFGWLVRNSALPPVEEGVPEGTGELRAAIERLLEWVRPIAGDNRDQEASAEETASLAALDAALLETEGK